MEPGTGAGVGLMLFAGVGVLVAIGGIVVALMMRRRALVRGIAATTLVCAALYMSLLLASSLTSHERVLGLNEPKYFCGFYLDCHVSATVTQVSKTQALGNPPNQATALGTFYVLTVRISSSAQRATLQPNDLSAVVVDGHGRQYERSVPGERALTAMLGDNPPFEQPIAPGGNGYVRQIVFDLPADVQRAELLITEGWVVDRLFELFLIGDEDSLLHKKTLIALE